MPTDVDICNMALSHIGDAAEVASISPPDGSPQAAYCSRFYPAVLSTLLETYNWSFATRRAQLSELSTSPSEWEHAYSAPNGMVSLLSIYPPDATSDISSVSQVGTASVVGGSLDLLQGIYTPQPFIVEGLPDGSRVIYTNQKTAVARYTANMTDTSKFSSLFTMALSWFLAAELAGPIVKGASGATTELRCTSVGEKYRVRAESIDANMALTKSAHNIPWMMDR